jgi:hypothetical protein
MKEPSYGIGSFREAYSNTLAQAPEDRFSKTHKNNDYKGVLTNTGTSKPTQKKKVTFDGVLMPPKPKNDGGPSRNYRRTRNTSIEFEEEIPEDVRPDVSQEKSVSNGDEENRPASATVRRPFDDVRPITFRPQQESEDVRQLRSPQPRGNEKSSSSEENTSPLKGKQPSYQIRSELFKDGLAEEVAAKIFNGTIELSVQEMLGISTMVKKILERKFKNRRVQPKRGKSAYVAILAEDNETEIPEMPTGVLLRGDYIDIDDLTLDPEVMFEYLTEDRDGMKAGSYVQKDIVECFHNDLSEEDERRNMIIVAKPSNGLRSIVTKINNREEDVEGILDTGSQIVSIDRLVATELGLTWDPNVTLQMQDSHGGLGKTEGLARNVPFKFGEITLYLQLHVQDRAPYMLLMGRPFDVLTESSLKTFANGDAELTITCPNTKRQCVIPTFPRGKIRNTIRINASRYNDAPSLKKSHSSDEPSKVEPPGNFQTSKI